VARISTAPDPSHRRAGGLFSSAGRSPDVLIWTRRASSPSSCGRSSSWWSTTALMKRLLALPIASGPPQAQLLTSGDRGRDSRRVALGNDIRQPHVRMLDVIGGGHGHRYECAELPRRSLIAGNGVTSIPMIDAAALALVLSFATWTRAPGERRQALDRVRPGGARGGQRPIAGRRVSRSPTAAAGRARAGAPIRTAPG
jgi:hypothetical protein